MDEFLEQWMRFDRVLNSVKDRRGFSAVHARTGPGHDGGDAPAGIGRGLEQSRISRNSTRPTTRFLNSDLAALYGLPAPAREFDRVEFPADYRAGGHSGQAVFLALTSKPADTSPTARGLFVREQFLCQEVPHPPPGVSTNLPRSTKEKPQTNRDRLGSSSDAVESCASCHNLIDPIGFGLEKFDAIGQRREKLKLTFTERGSRREEAQAGDSRAGPEYAGRQSRDLKNAEFSSPRELGRILAASTQCQECMVKQMFPLCDGPAREA